MQHAPVPLTQDLVLIGGGHAHALVLRSWGMKPLPGARLTVINPGPTAPYTGMLPGFVAGHYTRDDLDIDLVRLCRFAGARLILGRADGIDRDRKHIYIEGRGEIAYDIASIDIGITSAMPDLPGFLDHGIPAKPLDRFADAWRAYLKCASPGPIAVIGAGVGGVELALAMDFALRARKARPDITLIDSGRALSTLAEKARTTLLDRLTRQNITLLEHTKVTSIGKDHVALEGREPIPALFTVGAAGARPWPWVSQQDLDTNDGFLTVDQHLRTSDPSVYAAGDCAHMPFAPRPKAGVFAVRAAPVLAHNLRADLLGSARRPFRPQGDYLKLISLGEKSALLEKWGMTATGPKLWTLKDRIDQRFMSRLRDLPKMAQPALPATVAKGVRDEIADGKPMCAGCGSKVGPDALKAALETLPTPSRSDISALPGDDAAVLTLGDERQVISTDHLRAFTDDPAIFARIAACHALGDIWAMGAAPQAALATVTLPRMAPKMQERWLTEILAAANDVMTQAGASVAGGHTAQGAEFSLGFTVTGLAPTDPITLAGAQAGDTLILTRPLGSGVLLAAEMAMSANGSDIADLLATMSRPQIEEARILAGAKAMTDVTGFGLAGHLMNMLKASHVSAEIDLSTIPTYSGAAKALKNGHRSTLAPQNEAALAGQITLPDRSVTAILFDPQTAGGLLAAVDPASAPQVLQDLRTAGSEVAQIGSVQDGKPHITVT